jgi:hypothetical protein
MADATRWETVVAGPFQPGGAGFIRDHDSNLGIEAPLLNRVVDRLEIAAAAGDENP